MGTRKSSHQAKMQSHCEGNGGEPGVMPFFAGHTKRPSCLLTGAELNLEDADSADLSTNARQGKPYERKGEVIGQVLNE